MRRKTGLTLVVLLPLCLAPACGDGGGHDSQINLPVDPGRTLGSLTEQEIDAICDELHRATATVLDQDRTCMLSAQLDKQLTGGAEEVCAEHYQLCLQTELKNNPFNRCGLQKKPQAGQACPATARELEQCASARLAILEAYVSGLACASTEAVPALDPPSCASLDAKCPGVW